MAVAPGRERRAEKDDVIGQETPEHGRVQRIAEQAGHAGRLVCGDDGWRHVEAAEGQAGQRFPVSFPLRGAIAAA